jgi:hypothetical protein
MFITLLIVTFLISATVSFIIVQVFSTPIAKILYRIVADEIAAAWVKYIRFAIYVVGISGGVRVNSLQRYIIPRVTEESPVELTSERWILEIYRTVIEALQSIAWMLLVFFVFALIAYVVVRIFESRQTPAE